MVCWHHYFLSENCKKLFIFRNEPRHPILKAFPPLGISEQNDFVFHWNESKFCDYISSKFKFQVKLNQRKFHLNDFLSKILKKTAICTEFYVAGEQAFVVLFKFNGQCIWILKLNLHFRFSTRAGTGLGSSSKARA